VRERRLVLVVVWLDTVLTVLWIGGMQWAWWTMGGTTGAARGGGGAMGFCLACCMFCNKLPQ
jgi:hypothetical protein